MEAICEKMQTKKKKRKRKTESENCLVRVNTLVKEGLEDYKKKRGISTTNDAIMILLLESKIVKMPMAES